MLGKSIFIRSVYEKIPENKDNRAIMNNKDQYSVYHFILFFFFLVKGLSSFAAEHPGLKFLREVPFGQSLLTEKEYDNLWKVWDNDSYEVAKKASKEERRQLTNKRYGFFSENPAEQSLPVGFTVNKKTKKWHANCFTCHASKVNGQLYLGKGNHLLDWDTFLEDLALSKHRVASLLGLISRGKMRIADEWSHRGAIDAVSFSAYFLVYRTTEMNLIAEDETPNGFGGLLKPGPIIAKPFWQTKRKKRIYCDSFDAKSPRALMQFTLNEESSGALVRSREKDFEQALDWINTIEDPVAYPFPIDQNKAESGFKLFQRRCSRCHGRYDSKPNYPEKTATFYEVNTDPMRGFGMDYPFRKFYSDSWLGYFSKGDVQLKARGYVAPPLNRIWAAAPYFHNGSIPTLYHVLFDEERPNIWKIKDHDGYDRQKVGLLVDSFEEIPYGLSMVEKRNYMNTTIDGNLNQGHKFSNSLSKLEKLALLEYLKTL